MESYHGLLQFFVFGARLICVLLRKTSRNPLTLKIPDGVIMFANQLLN
jgi:hypothetical protein